MSSDIKNLIKKHMKNNQYIRQAQYKKGFIASILLAIIALLVIGGGAYVYMWQKTNTQPSDVKIDCVAMNLPPDCNPGAKVVPPGTQNNITGTNQTQQTTPVTQKPNLPTANWKTYKNDKYGFEVKYPVNMTINFEEGSGVGFWNFNIYDTIQSEREDMVENETIPEFIMSNRTAPDSTFKIKNKFDSDDTGIIFQVGEKKLTAVCNGSNALKTDLINSLLLCNQILSTFKFTK